MPPAYIEAIYQEATPLLYKLGDDPENTETLEPLEVLNSRIIECNRAPNNESTVSQKIPQDQWIIPVTFFGPHYKIALENYAILRLDPQNEIARANLRVEKKLIDDFVAKRHFPPVWTIASADEHLQQNKASEPVTVRVAPSKPPAVIQSQIQYPWPTAKAADGSLIVGVRAHGRFGTQVCLETIEEDGGIIRRLQSASEAGLLEVENYMSTQGHKNLAVGQSGWSSKDRYDFAELLWVTSSRVQRKNLAAGLKDAAADCCVRFHLKGVNILTMTSFNKVLGRISARAQVMTPCERDGIPVPWEAGWESEFHDPAAVEKNATRRRRMKDAQAVASSSTARYSGPFPKKSVNDWEKSIEQRVQEMEAKLVGTNEAIGNLNNTVNTLADMLKDFLKSQQTR